MWPRSWLASFFVLGCGGEAPPSSALPSHLEAPAGPAAPEPVPITLLGTNDLHGHLEMLPLLAGYVAAYGGFIGAAVAAPGLLAVRVAGGVNLAVAWGFALIALAFVVALAALRLPEGD